MTRAHSSTSLLAVVGLVLATAIVLGWAIIGKHRLDPQARQLYKATRLVVAAKQPSPPAPGNVVTTVSPRPPLDAMASLQAQSAAPCRGPAGPAATSCRSPPSQRS